MHAAAAARKHWSKQQPAKLQELRSAKCRAVHNHQSIVAQATVVYGWEQQKEFKTFLVNQLTDLMEGLTNPAVIQESERTRALQKKYNELYMRRPRYGRQRLRDLQCLCILGTGLYVLSIMNKQGQ